VWGSTTRILLIVSKKTIKNEGFFALYKGFLPIWMRLGPWSLTFWVSFEWLRGACGVKGF